MSNFMLWVSRNAAPLIGGVIGFFLFSAIVVYQMVVKLREGRNDDLLLRGRPMSAYTPLDLQNNLLSSPYNNYGNKGRPKGVRPDGLLEDAPH